MQESIALIKDVVTSFVKKEKQLYRKWKQRLIYVQEPRLYFDKTKIYKYCDGRVCP